jgi:hypothetical protein
MLGLTRELIETALEHGGRFYLPYRLHATAEQFRRAYPQGAEFFAKKRIYDPDSLFENAFFLKYGSSGGGNPAARTDRFAGGRLNRPAAA